MTSIATSSGTSQSSSTGGGSFLPSYPQSPVLMEIAQYARSLAPQMLEWGQQQYNKNASLTDQMLADAKVYASPSRISQDMGMAEAGAGMAGDKARENTLRDLQSYGIDPSSGRYAALDKAERGKTAAAQAGAGNMQRMATEATGRAMKSEALNAQLSNTNIGANLMRLPNDYLGTASQLKYPPLGQNPQNSQSTSQNQSRSDTYSPLTSHAPGSGSGSGSGSKSPGNQGSGNPRNPFGGGGNGDTTVNSRGGNMPSTGGGQQGDGSYHGPTAYQGAAIHQVPPYGGGDNSGYYDPASYAQNSNELPSWNQNYDPYSAYDDGSVWGTQDFNTPTSGWGDQYTGMGDGSNWNDGNNFNGDWGANPMSGSDAGSWGDAGQYDFGSYGNTYDTGSSGDTGSWGGGGGYTDYGQSGGSYYGGDSGAQDYGGSDYISSDYAKGGAVGGGAAPGAGPGATSGGFVSKQLSPSQGQQVDDVPANLNADEFVVPRDVALWKGQEFFQKLIEQSRKARTMAPAQPTQDQNGDQNAAMGGAMTPGMYQNFNRRVRPPTPAQGAQPFDNTMPSNPGMGGMGGEMSAGPRSRGRSNSFDTMPRNTGYTPPTMLGMG